MDLHKIETPGIAHFAYLLADDGVAAVIDPCRDADRYLALARELGVQIRYVVETHRQEDFIMGAAYLAERSGAEIVNGRHELFGHGDLRLDDDATFTVGKVGLRALHTPGHTPESMSYAIHPPGDDQQAWGVFTGDALFFGDTGRTDLPDADRAVENAALLYDSIHDRLAPLGDHAMIFPAHGPGSVCGSAMAPLPASTIGAERRKNPVFTMSRDDFARHKGGERLPRPPYFRIAEELNLEGGLPPAWDPGDVPLMSVEAFAEHAGEHVVDAREPEAFAGGHIDGSYSIWQGGLPVFGGWVAGRDTPIHLVTEKVGDLEAALLHLSRIGLDGVRGALAGGFSAWRKSGRPLSTAGTLDARTLARMGGVQILDVRDDDEFSSGHIPGAHHMYVGHLEDRQGDLDLDPERPVAVTCSVGHRAGLGVSILLRAGFTDVSNLLGGMTAWKALGLPLEEGDEPAPGPGTEESRPEAP